MREIFVTQLAKEVLGPRNGINEIIPESPLGEYITGVLAPTVGEAQTNIDDESVIPTEDTPASEEELPEVVDVPPLFSPALNPKNRPPTMGLSFAIESSDPPKVAICVTWARYRPLRRDTRTSWQRIPRPAYITSLDLHPDISPIWINDQARVVSQDQAEISLHFDVRTDNSMHFISIYLVNRVAVAQGQLVTAEHHVFQPQIRVICERGNLVPGERAKPKSYDERMLEFVYRNKRVLARGHLCSVIWQQIDPEASAPSNLDFPSSANDPPFHWLDGDTLDESNRRRFTAPHVRTEYIPIYSITSPDLQWCPSYGPEPEFRAQLLAEMYNEHELQGALQPLIDGYENWINHIEGESARLADNRDISENLVRSCRAVLQRMRMGLQILITNREARLSFCFANKAMDLQSTWPPRLAPLVWYPFQLAFILLAIESITNPRSEFRDVCDLVWVPTGAGKTEAYMGLMAFTIAYRRRRSLILEQPQSGEGVSVITRYTLRLLTIQQFRRTVSLISACELLRVSNLERENEIGWRPNGFSSAVNFLWGSAPFSVGLWVGGNVTPNRMETLNFNPPVPGALDILTRGAPAEFGEPAQILSCPACGNILSVPDMGLSPGLHTFYFIVRVENNGNLATALSGISGRTFHNSTIDRYESVQHVSPRYWTLKFDLRTIEALHSDDVDEIWDLIRQFLADNGAVIALIPSRAARPGYFKRHYIGARGGNIDFDFDIFCTKMDCPLHLLWFGGAPHGRVWGTVPGALAQDNRLRNASLPDRNHLLAVPEAFQVNSSYICDRIPINALTVDEQIYQRVPTIVIATVDKFARPAFEPRASAIFGNVDHHSCVWGYYRVGAHPKADASGHPTPVGRANMRNYIHVNMLDQPDLILQDELHLIEGPLGSLVGIYETGIEFLCRERCEFPTKYIASTATIRRADDQVQSVFQRRLQIFPPPGLVSNDRFFLRDEEVSPFLDSQAGRLYVGISAPGRGPLTPLRNIWSRLLQTAHEERNNPRIDPFWTLTGYFNSVRELGGARALYRQDILQRVTEIGAGNARPLSDERALELSSRTSSTNLPGILDTLSRSGLDSPDSLFTTSMFGTGVDISRIGLMVVNGQPKTTSSYIQSTGRVGRSSGALVVIFYRAARPRDLSHYEFFAGYHRQLHRFVEPITVYPFAPTSIEQAAGPIGVLILRNRARTGTNWYQDSAATLMATQRQAPEVQDLTRIMEERGRNQPTFRIPQAVELRRRVNSELDQWQSFASVLPNLSYVEYTMASRPTHPVVLGDPQHQHAGLPVVYPNAPQSLRDIEETTGFQT
jgi:hypothetical protein